MCRRNRGQSLTTKQWPCIFLGYGDTEFDYRLWDLKHKKLIRSRDVVFHKNETIKEVQQTRESTFRIPDLIADSSTENATNTRDVQEEHDHHDELEIDGDTESVEQRKQPHTLEIPQPVVRRILREHQPSSRYPSSEYLLITNEGELESFREVQTHKEKDKWIKVMMEEMTSLQKNDTYELVKLPKGKKALKNKLVYKLKKDGDKLVQYKSYLVVKDLRQKQ